MRQDRSRRDFLKTAFAASLAGLATSAACDDEGAYVRKAGDAATQSNAVPLVASRDHAPGITVVHRASDGPEPPPDLSVGQHFTPQDVNWSHPVYMSHFDQPDALKDWKLEGGKRMALKSGRLILESTPPEGEPSANDNHLVCWLTKEMPADFLLEFTVCPQNRKHGLNIVFFNARGKNGESIFAPTLKPRNGLFAQYTNGDLNNYHISYWAGDRGTTNLRKNAGFHLLATGKDLIAPAPANVFQTVRVYKRGGMIRLTVDDIISLAFIDDGKKWGPVWNQPGWIGLRQMAHTVHCEYGYLKVYRLTDSPGK